MTVLLTSYYYKPHFGGIENSLYHIGLALKEKGHRVIIFASDADRSKKGRLPAEEVLDGLMVVRFRRFIPHFFLFSCFGFFIDHFRISGKLRQLAAGHFIDLIISRHYRVIPSILLVFPNVYHCYIIPGIAKFQQKGEDENDLLPSVKKHILQFYSNFISLPLKHIFQKLSLRNTHCIIFSESVRKQMNEAYPAYKGIVTKMQPGVDTERFKPSDTARSYREFTFLIAGRLIHHKRIDMAIKALRKMDNPRARLLIVGDGPKRGELLMLADQEGIRERVIFKGYDQEPEKYYRDSDAFLMTSTHESFGQTILEAYSSGLPVVGFTSEDKRVQTATSELVQDGVNGFLCEFSVEGLASKMQYCMNIPIGQYREMSLRNRSLAAENYRWDFLADRIIQNYRQIVSK